MVLKMGKHQKYKIKTSHLKHLLHKTNYVGTWNALSEN